MSTFKIEVRARTFARAWLNTALAQSEDEERPALYRATLIELFDTGVRLVTTDSFMLLRSWVPAGIDSFHETISEPGLDEMPEDSIVVVDGDRRVKALMAWLWSSTKAEEKDAPIEALTMFPATLSDPDTPTLMDMDRPGISFVTSNERVTTGLFEGKFPGWRELGMGATKKRDGIVLNPVFMARFGQMGTMASDQPVVARLSFGALDGAGFVVTSRPEVHGIVMAVKEL